ncbi:MAG TPA: redoxin domain-containing protein [Fimbriimonadaceae bacterium]|nr:redoxin domain-containing protein [Fimbriimonadaceae bacterium]HRJ31994.1 redoxin domain-containing protein [Fimbriimonadaceae bacterium]
MALQIGSPAPDFTLKTLSENGLEDRSLGAHRGQSAVVLLFVPGAFTGVCTEEMCDVTAGLSEYTDLGVVVYGISVDSAFAQGAWKKQAGIGFDLLSDYGRAVTQAYDVVLPDLAGLGGSASLRAVYLIDRDGTIRYVEVTENPGVLPKLDALKEAIRAL